jgi:hypothetical protein
MILSNSDPSFKVFPGIVLPLFYLLLILFLAFSNPFAIILSVTLFTPGEFHL